MLRSEIKSYVRNKAKEFDEMGMAEALLDEDVNQAMWGVQLDLIPYNVKSFNKIHYATGRYFALPSDCLNSPNAIEDVLGGAGSKAEGGIITSNGGTIGLLAIEPGTEWNGWTLSFNDTGTLGGLTINFATKAINVNYNGGTTTNSQMSDFLNADVTFSSIFIATNSEPSETMLDEIMVLDTVGASGTGWKGCKELSVKDRNRILNDTYSKPTASQPAYLRHGNSTGSQMVEIFPNEMKFSKVFYYYRFAAMTADSDVLPIPDEYRELYLLKLLTKMYETLNRQAEEQEKKMDYAKKKVEYEEAYQKALTYQQLENKMIHSNDSE